MKKVEIEKNTMSILFSCTKNVLLTIGAVYLLYFVGGLVVDNWTTISTSIISGVSFVATHIHSFFKPVMAVLFEHLGTIFIGWLICSLWTFCVIYKFESSELLITPKAIYVMAGVLVPIGSVIFFMISYIFPSIFSFLAAVFGLILFFVSIAIIGVVFFDNGTITYYETPQQLDLFKNNTITSADEYHC
jgi:hypothetical protein